MFSRWTCYSCWHLGCGGWRQQRCTHNSWLGPSTPRSSVASLAATTTIVVAAATAPSPPGPRWLSTATAVASCATAAAAAPSVASSSHCRLDLFRACFATVLTTTRRCGIKRFGTFCARMLLPPPTITITSWPVKPSTTTTPYSASSGNFLVFLFFLVVYCCSCAAKGGAMMSRAPRSSTTRVT